MTADDTTPQTSAERAAVPKHIYEAMRSVLRDRDRELLQLKGPCARAACRLHYAHIGPCDTRKAVTDDQ